MKKIKDLGIKIGLKKDQVNRNLLILSTLFLLSTLVVMLFSLFILQNMLSTNYNSQKAKQDRFNFWIEKVEEYPNSPDVLYNASVSALEVNRDETALKLVNKAVILDPEFIEAINLQQEIISNAR